MSGIWIRLFRIPAKKQKSQRTRFTIIGRLSRFTSADAHHFRFSSFVDINGRLVLDLTLFVSSENYTSTTRPAYSSLLQWPDQWFVTPQKRSAALARTDHLGFSLLDLDNMNDEQWKNMSTSAGSGAIPQSLKWSSPTVTDLVKQPQHATRFRLDALADGFFRPLHQLLGKKRYMLSANKPCSLDCVAYAYLALAYTPQFPHAWAAEAMKARYPELCDYVHRLSKESFGGPVSVSHALGSEAGQSKPHAEGVSSLPWGKPDSRGFSAAALSLVRGALHSMPSAGHFQTDKMVLDNAGAEEQSQSAVSDTSAKNLNIVPVLIGVGSTLAAVGAYLHYFRVPSNPDPRRKTLLELGEAGAMLDLATFGAYGPIHMEEMPRQGRIPVGVELDVEVQNHDVNELGKA